MMMFRSGCSGSCKPADKGVEAWVTPSLAHAISDGCMVSCTAVSAFLSRQRDDGAGCDTKCFYASDCWVGSSVTIRQVLMTSI